MDEDVVDAGVNEAKTQLSLVKPLWAMNETRKFLGALLEVSYLTALVAMAIHFPKSVEHVLRVSLSLPMFQCRASSAFPSPCVALFCPFSLSLPKIFDYITKTLR